MQLAAVGGAGVSDHECVVVAVIGIANGAVDAALGGQSDEQQGADAALAQQVIETCSVKSAVKRLADFGFAVARCQAIVVRARRAFATHGQRRIAITAARVEATARATVGVLARDHAQPDDKHSGSTCGAQDALHLVYGWFYA